MCGDRWPVTIGSFCFFPIRLEPVMPKDPRLEALSEDRGLLRGTA